MDMLALAWAGLIGFGVIMYVLLGGADIGIGIMSIFIRDAHERDLMISAILPVWDGNQTWLVFGGAALYGAFPLAFSTLLPIFYIPIFVMVVALLLRGIAFEFRLKAKKSKTWWDGLFFIGSVAATIVQGLVLGTFVSGFTLTSPEAMAHTYQWMNPFGFACAFGLICGYILLGANFLIIKTTGELQQKCFRIASVVQYFILFGFVVVSVWSPFLDPAIAQRWLDPSNMFYLAILPFLTMVFFILHWRALRLRHEVTPFWCAIGMFVMCYLGFIISIYPFIVPRRITYIEAAADPSALLFMFVGACIMLVPLLYYTYQGYRVFAGKVIEPIGY